MRSDPSAATGQIPREPLRCVCGCLEPFHDLSTRGERTGCSNSACGCKRFAASQDGGDA